MNDADTLGTGAALKQDDKPAAIHGNSHSNRLRNRARNIGAAIGSVAAVGAVIGGLTGYWNAWKAVKTEIFHESQSLQQNAAARPDVAPRLSLIVLPFANLNNDPEQNYFAEGITTDLTTDLGQMPGAFVIGRGTAFTYKNKQVDLNMLGKELGIRWAVQGAVQRSGDHVRVNVFLTDLSTGGDFWSDRFDGERSNLADLQDQIVARLARSLSIELIQAEGRRRGQSERSSNPDAVDLAMRGWAKLYEPRTQVHTREASELFDSALRLDPDNVDAMIGKSWCLAINLFNQWSASVETDVRIATELIDRALAKRPSSALAHTVKGEVNRLGNPEAAIAEYDAALQTDPNYPPAYMFKGNALTMSGRSREALSQVQIALRLSPKDPLAPIMRYYLCHAHLHLREYVDAIDECRRALNLNKAFWYLYPDLIVAYSETGQLEQARQALADLYRIRPEFTVQRFQQLAFSFSSNPQFRKELEEILIEGMRKAGVREQ
jgi:TolB-like protein/Flp pilus assembly protein TadD